MYETVITKDNNGAEINLPVGSLAQNFTYDAFGNLQTITVVYAGVTYVQTFTFEAAINGKMLSVSRWVAQ